MKTKLTKGLNEDDAKEILQQHKGCSRYRKRVIALMNEEIDSLRGDMLRDEKYDSPNWALIQVDRIAQEKALRKIISLFEN